MIVFVVGVMVGLTSACTDGPGSSTSNSTVSSTVSSTTEVAAAPVAGCSADTVTGRGDAGDEMHVFDDSSAPTVAWSMPVGGVDAASDQIDGIAVTDEGTTTISGVFRNRVDIGDTELTSHGEGDIFVASITSEGDVDWVKQFGSTGDDNTYDTEVDGEGNIYLSGWYTGTVDFGDTELTASGSVDAFVVKLAPDGTTEWARSFGGTAGDGGNEISVRADGETAVSVITAGDVVIDEESYSFGGGGRDSFVVRLAPDGTTRWVHQFDGPGNERIRAIALGPDGEVAVGFEYRGRLRSGSETLAARGGWDGALARLTPDGALDWLRPVAGEGTDNTRGVGIAPDGSIYASGTFHDAITLIDRDQPAAGTGSDDYVAKVDPEGTTEWVVTMGGDGPGTGGELQANDSGVFTSGLLETEVTVRRGTEVLGEVASPTGRPTAYLLALDPSGDLRFAYTPSPEPDEGRAFGDVLEVSDSGAVLVQALRFGGTISVAGHPMSTPGSKDSAVVFLCLGSS